MTDATQESGLYTPDPPPSLNAQPDDIATLETFIRRFGWHEFLWHVGQLLVNEHGQATGNRQGAMRAMANYINFIVPGAHWLDHELVIHLPEADPP